MKAKAKKIPGFIRPMLCKKVAKLPTGGEWVYEVKRGGQRTIAVKDGRRVKLFGEDGQRFDCPPIEETLRQVPFERAVIDGEIISLDAQSKPGAHKTNHEI